MTCNTIPQPTPQYAHAVFTASLSDAMDSLATHFLLRAQRAYVEWSDEDVSAPGIGSFSRFTASSHGSESAREVSEKPRTPRSAWVIVDPPTPLKATGAARRVPYQNGVCNQINGTFTAFAKLTECVG